jgi:hypothetical protein
MRLKGTTLVALQPEVANASLRRRASTKRCVRRSKPPPQSAGRGPFREGRGGVPRRRLVNSRLPDNGLKPTKAALASAAAALAA